MPHHINLSKKYLICLSASARKLSGRGVGSAGFAVAIEFALIFSFVMIMLPHLFNANDGRWKAATGVPVIILFVIEVCYRKEIEIVSQNYFDYYPKALYYLFIILTIISAAYLFASLIGK